MKKTCIYISGFSMRRMRAVVPAIVLAFVSVFTPTQTEAAGSHLDYSFGDRGRVNFSFGGINFNIPTAVAIQPDGKIVVVGRVDIAGDSDFGIARLNANGTFDNTFDGDGRTTISFGVGTVDEPRAVLIQPDGKIVVVGESRAASCRFAILRLTDQGLPDGTFDGDGRALMDFGTYSSAEAVAIQADGKLVVVGSATAGTNVEGGGVGTNWAMLRLTTGGAPDNTFGNQGRVVTSFNSGVHEARSVVVLPDNRIVVAGKVATSTGDDFGLVRYTDQGIPDPALNGNGKAIIDIDQGDDDLEVVRRTPDGKLIIGGTADIAGGNEMAIALVRCSIDGVLDPSFGNGGKVLSKFQPDGYTTRLADLDINGNGDIAVSGRISGANSSNGSFNVIKYLPNGQLDLKFGSGGRVGTVFGQGLREATGVAFQPDGKIIAIGVVRDYAQFGIARYKPRSIATEGDFDGDGRAEIGVYRRGDGIWYLQNPVTGVKSYVRFGLAVDEPVPGDYDGDGKTDVAVFRPTNGTWYVNRSSDGQLIVMPFGLSNDIPLPGDYDGDGKTDFAVYRMSNGTWYLQQSSLGLQIIKYGSDIAFPVVGDYDGDGETDLAVYRPIDKTWWIRASALSLNVIQFGAGGDLPIPADYDGDGVTDVATFRTDGNWWVRRSQTETTHSDHWGISSDIATPADYDGDGKANLSVFRAETGVWYVMRSDGTILILEWGIAGDIPVAGITFRALA